VAGDRVDVPAGPVNDPQLLWPPSRVVHFLGVIMYQYLDFCRGW
jgi:hypothetical protein